MTERELASPVRAPAHEENALATNAIVVKRPDRRRWVIRGASAADVLNGLVTNDISALTAGSGCYAAALTPKGKIIADLRIFAREEDFLVDTTAAAANGWADVLRKYVNPRLARYDEITDTTADVAVAGPQANAVIAAAMDLDADQLRNLQPHAHVAPSPGGDVQLIAMTPELTETAYDLIITADGEPRLIEALTAAGATAASAAVWEVSRISRGWPVWGQDMDETTLAQEASLDAFDAISYTKGCYTGQETVARVHFRGHVNRYLRRVGYSPDAAIPRGADVVDDAGKSVGDVRSSAMSARRGVAIAMIRREIPDDGVVHARWNEHSAALRLTGAE